MVQDGQNQLKKQIKVTTFLEIQMDDSTDVANCIQFCATSGEIAVILFMKTYSFENPYPIIKQVKVFLSCSLKQLNISIVIERNTSQFLCSDEAKAITGKGWLYCQVEI